MRTKRAFLAEILSIALVGAAIAPSAVAMDRYKDVHGRVRKGAKMRLSAATFFGAGGVEEFVGVAIAPDGRIMAIGNSWGAPFPEHPRTKVLGQDLPWPVPLYSVNGRLRPGRGAGGAMGGLPSTDHPNRTGFLAFYTPDLSRVDEVLRLGWGSANISAVRRMRDGSLVIAGRSSRPFDAGLCPPEKRHRQPLPEDVPFEPLVYEGVTLPGDVYIAKLTPELTGFSWVWTLEGFGQAPARLYEGGNGEVVFRQRHYLWRIAGDGSAFRDYRGTPLGENSTRVRGISPVDGRVITGGSWLIGTGREPWKQPWMDVYDSDGRHIESYYWWSGPLAGHDDFRLVSDSGLDMVEPLQNGHYVLSGGSDGGNSVFCRHPADITKEPKSSGLPMSTWGAGAGHWSHLVRFNPYDLNDVAYTLWSSFTPTGPGSIYVHHLRGLNDGSLVVMGYASPFLVQTTNRWYHANTHHFYEGKPSHPVFRPNGWPIFQGLGGHGNYVAVLNPQFDNLIWSSAIANCEHLDAAANEKGLAVVGRCSGEVAADGRTPAFTPYDVADWPKLIAKLTAAAKPGPPSPARQVWDRLSAQTRAALAALPANQAPPEELRARLLDDFDRILFDDRTFHDPAAWPNAAFDPYEERLLAKLRAGDIAEDELGYLNRTLFEQAFPDHVFARPKNNLTPVMGAAQPRHGGGVCDGYIYFLEAPAGTRLDLVPEPKEPAPVEAKADAPAPPPVAKQDGTTTTRSIGGTFDFAFDRERRRAARVPGYCTSYAVLRSPAKLRPLFLHGWGEKGGIQVAYGNDGGLKEDIGITATGSGTLLLNGQNTKPAADWERFACGEWLLKEKDEAPLRVTFDALHGWTELTDMFGRLVNPSRGLLSDTVLATLVARFRMTADLTLSVGAHTCKLPKVPCSLSLRDMGGRGNWAMRMDIRTGFAPEQLGLTREGTNRVSMILSHEVFSAPPQAHAAPRTKGMSTALDEPMALPE
jgi:hypothetical protein